MLQESVGSASNLIYAVDYMEKRDDGPRKVYYRIAGHYHLGRPLDRPMSTGDPSSSSTTTRLMKAGPSSFYTSLPDGNVLFMWFECRVALTCVNKRWVHAEKVSTFPPHLTTTWVRQEVPPISSLVRKCHLLSKNYRRVHGVVSFGICARCALHGCSVETSCFFSDWFIAEQFAGSPERE